MIIVTVTLFAFGKILLEKSKIFPTTPRKYTHRSLKVLQFKRGSVPGKSNEDLNKWNRDNTLTTENGGPRGKDEDQSGFPPNSKVD